MSLAVALKVELFRRLAEHPQMAGVDVAYLADGRAHEANRELVHGGDLAVTIAWSAFTSARKPRDETATFSVAVARYDPAADVVANETRAAELGAVLEDLFANQASWGAAVPGNRTAAAVGFESHTDQLDDGGVLTTLIYKVQFVSRLF